MFHIKTIKSIYLIQFHDLNSSDVDKFFYFISSLFENKKYFKLIFDLSNMKVSDSAFLPKIIPFMVKNKKNTITYIDKTAIIIKNKTIKNIFNNFVFKIHPPVKPNIITNKIDEALDFLY